MTGNNIHCDSFYETEYFSRLGNKVISKIEMVSTLVALGQLPEDILNEKGKKLKVPEEIENLFR